MAIDVINLNNVHPVERHVRDATRHVIRTGVPLGMPDDPLRRVIDQRPIDVPAIIDDGHVGHPKPIIHDDATIGRVSVS